MMKFNRDPAHKLHILQYTNGSGEVVRTYRPYRIGRARFYPLEIS
jgi:hypothetical protein